MASLGDEKGVHKPRSVLMECRAPNKEGSSLDETLALWVARCPHAVEPCLCIVEGIWFSDDSQYLLLQSFWRWKSSLPTKICSENLLLPTIQFPNFNHTWLLLVFGWTMLGCHFFSLLLVAKRQTLAVSKNLYKMNSDVLVVLEFPWMIPYVDIETWLDDWPTAYVCFMFWIQLLDWSVCEATVNEKTHVWLDGAGACNRDDSQYLLL